MTWTAPASNGGAPILDYTILWDQGTGVYVTAASGVTNTAYTKTVATIGATFKFKVQARTLVGLGAQSSELSIVSATVPAKPDAPLTAYDGVADSVTIDWSASDNGGLSITGYILQIQKQDSSWTTEPINCDGLNNATVKSNTACTIPATILRASPFSLT